MKTKTTTIGDLRYLLAGIADSVGWSEKNRCYIAREGYFYTFGRTAEKMAASIKRAVPAAEILDSYDHFTAFRGGSSLANSSHFGVRFTLNMD